VAHLALSGYVAAPLLRAPILTSTCHSRMGKIGRYHLKLWIGFPDESAAYLPA
jgi:hypothetical protein